jgi:FtsP/CotA-like multicopper oxidase with cupredoxin domain
MARGRESRDYSPDTAHRSSPPAVHSTTGDTIRIHATNGLGNSQLGTAIHAHGMMFNNTNWYDGAVGVTQCPIPPGETLTYDIDTSIQVSSTPSAHVSQSSVRVF